MKAQNKGQGSDFQTNPVVGHCEFWSASNNKEKKEKRGGESKQAKVWSGGAGQRL